jgi:formylglycine-generating enzyme required for sulfatase activity
MKRFILLSLIVCLGLATYAQSPLKTVSFHKNPNEIVDLRELKEKAGRDSDLDGNKAARIRVKAQGFDEKKMLDFTVFPRPGMEVIYKEFQQGEMWVYVSSKVQGTLVIKYMGEFEFKLPNKLEPKCGYDLVLGMETGTLVIRAIPSNADIYVDNEKVGTGYASKAVSVGTEHHYKVICNDYYPKEGVVYFSQREEKQIEVELEPNFGYITIKSEPSGAEVYVDDVKVGVTPYLMKKIPLGDHVVELRKTGYENYADMVTIKVRETNKKFENVKLVEDKSIPQPPVATTTTTPTTTTTAGNRTFTVNGVSFDMIAVKGGTFTMGSTDQYADSDEKIIHNVTVSDFMIGKFEVTQKLWKAVMGSNPSYFKGDNLPVENVSWNDAQEFIRKLNQQTGQNFRLPTEAEWEYAARGGTNTSLYNGENINKRGKNNSPNLDKLAWYGGNCGQNYTSYAGCDVSNGYDISGWSEKQYNDSKGGTHPVGLKQPNAYGLYDMLGNVWEWCQDWYGDYSSGSQTNPTGPSSGSSRVLRGGSWYNYARYCRVSPRDGRYPDFRSDILGFRLALVP